MKTPEQNEKHIQAMIAHKKKTGPRPFWNQSQFRVQLKKAGCNQTRRNRICADIVRHWEQQTKAQANYIPGSVTAALIGITPARLRQLCQAKEIDAQKRGRDWWVCPESAKAYKEARERGEIKRGPTPSD